MAVVRPDRLDLRKDIEFNTTIKSAQFNEATDRWSITTDKGHVIDARFLVTCCGLSLSAPLTSPFSGTGDVQGAVVPHRTLAEGPGRFGRQARRRGRHRRDGDPGCSNHCRQGRSPDSIRPYSAVRNSDEEPEIHANGWGGVQSPEFSQIAQQVPHTFSGFARSTSRTSGLRRRGRSRAVLEEIYQDGSLEFWIASFVELFLDPEVSEQVSEFVREKMRAAHGPSPLRYPDPEGLGFGTHHPMPLETGFTEGIPSSQRRSGQRQGQSKVNGLRRMGSN